MVILLFHSIAMNKIVRTNCRGDAFEFSRRSSLTSTSLSRSVRLDTRSLPPFFLTTDIQWRHHQGILPYTVTWHISLDFTQISISRSLDTQYAVKRDQNTKNRITFWQKKTSHFFLKVLETIWRCWTSSRSSAKVGSSCGASGELDSSRKTGTLDSHRLSTRSSKPSFFRYVHNLM